MLTTLSHARSTRISMHIPDSARTLIASPRTLHTAALRSVALSLYITTRHVPAQPVWICARWQYLHCCHIPPTRIHSRFRSIKVILRNNYTGSWGKHEHAARHFVPTAGTRSLLLPLSLGDVHTTCLRNPWQRRRPQGR